MVGPPELEPGANAGILLRRATRLEIVSARKLVLARANINSFGYDIDGHGRQGEFTHARKQTGGMGEFAVVASSSGLRISTAGTNPLTSPCFVCHAAQRQRPAPPGTIVATVCIDGGESRR